MFFKIYSFILKIKSEFINSKQKYISKKDIKLIGSKVFNNYFLKVFANYNKKNKKSCRKVNRKILI